MMLRSSAVTVVFGVRMISVLKQIFEVIIDPQAGDKSLEIDSIRLMNSW